MYLHLLAAANYVHGARDEQGYYGKGKHPSKSLVTESISSTADAGAAAGGFSFFVFCFFFAFFFFFRPLRKTPFRPDQLHPMHRTKSHKLIKGPARVAADWLSDRPTRNRSCVEVDSAR